MKKFEITILAVPGMNAEEKIQRMFYNLPHTLQTQAIETLPYAITDKRGVVREKAERYYISDVMLDEAAVHLLHYIFAHKTWCLRYLIIQTDTR